MWIILYISYRKISFLNSQSLFVVEILCSQQSTVTNANVYVNKNKLFSNIYLSVYQLFILDDTSHNKPST